MQKLITQPWQPTASLENVRLRAHVYKKIREFFSLRNILEVETPLLCQHGITDVFIESFPSQNYFLQTSPEYAMKRLLANNFGAIYQLCKAFRQGDYGRQHNPEFTILEWYRPGFNHHQLMNEVDELLQCILNSVPAEKISYQQLFQHFVSIDPFSCSLKSLQDILLAHQFFDEKKLSELNLDQDACLQLILSHLIEPKLGFSAPIFIYDFPPTQAALAKINSEHNPPVAERFELYIQGMEIANGFHELSDAAEQRRRFEKDQIVRKKAGQFIPTIDERLLSALENGIPDCSGLALGVDRLLMCLIQTKNISDVITFPWEMA